MLKPVSAFVSYNAEWRELAQVITRDIYLNNPNVKWNDIIGLENPKRLIKESVVYPIKVPYTCSKINGIYRKFIYYIISIYLLIF